MRNKNSGKPRLPLMDEPVSDQVEEIPRTTPSSKAERQEFFLPVTGFVWFYPEEVHVIDHPAFQRLGRINQLGQAYLVFRGATHRRLEHALGAVHIVQRMISAAARNAEKAQYRGEALAPPLSDNEERFVRLGALLHDIGHLAAGHTLEDELGLLSAHDADERLDLIFHAQDFDVEAHPSLEHLIDRHYAQYVPKNLRGKISPTNIVRMLIRKIPRDSQGAYDLSADRYQKEHEVLTGSSDMRLHICSNMIGNTICADLLDYLFRDWYHLGKPRTFDDRILQYMEIRSVPLEDSNISPTCASPNDRFVVALGRSPKIRTDGVSAILELLEWRYQLAETVLFHRTKLSAAGMLDRALFELWEGAPESEILETVLPLSDEQLLDKSIDIARLHLEGAPDENEKVRFRIAIENLRNIKGRKLFAELKTWGVDDLGPNPLARVKKLYGAGSKDPKKAARSRTQALRQLELDFGLRPGSLAMYCAEMKPKIAEVTISVGSDIEPFNRYEQTHGDQKLSGGHLEAQIERFRRLWRVHFFIERDEQARLQAIGLLSTLVDAIEALVLGTASDSTSRARDFALTLHARENDKWHNRTVLQQAVQAARADPSHPVAQRYPTGAPAISSFFIEASN